MKNVRFLLALFSLIGQHWLHAVEDSPKKSFKPLTVNNKTESAEEQKAQEETPQKKEGKVAVKNDIEEIKKLEAANTFLEVVYGVWDGFQSIGPFIIPPSATFVLFKEHAESTRVPMVFVSVLAGQFVGTYIPRSPIETKSFAYRCGNCIFVASLFGACIWLIN